MVATESKRRLEVQLIEGNIVDLRSQAYVLGVYDHVRPTGAASAVDELVGGRLSALLQSRMFGSRLGEVSLLPIPRHGSFTDLVAFVGLGPISEFNPRYLEFIGENVSRVLSVSGVTSFVTVPLGASAQTGVGEFLETFLMGVARGLESGDPDCEFKSVQICELDSGKADQMWQELKRIEGSELASRMRLQLETTRRRIPQSLSRAPRRSAERTADPIYLMVRSQNLGTHIKLSFALLTEGGNAAIYTDEHEITHADRNEVQKLLQRARVVDRQIGAVVAERFLPPSFRERVEPKLCEPSNPRPLVIIHDDWGSVIPWEAMHLGENCPALLAGVSRQLLAERWNDSVARPGLIGNARPRMLMIYDPTEDLPGADKEGQQLKRRLEQNRVHLTIIKAEEATRERLIRELQENDYDIIHYAGHADFEDGEPSESGLLCSDGRLVARELPRARISPQLIFLNACESGRMRRKKVMNSEIQSDVEGHLNANASLAEAFITRGTGNFIGTYWPVNDTAALAFADAFYDKLLGGATMAAALKYARTATHASNAADWANYMHFGDPNYRIREA